MGVPLAMRLFLLVLSAALVACVGATEPNPANCLMPGDTVAYSVVSLGGIAIACDWTVQKTVHCYVEGQRPPKYGRADCMEGEKWPRH